MIEAFFFSPREIRESHRSLVQQVERRSFFDPDKERDGLSLRAFLFNFDEITRFALRAVKSGAFEPEPGKEIWLVEEGKRRQMFSFPWLTHFLYGHLSRSIERCTGDLLHDSLYSYRKGRGTVSAVRRVQQFCKHSSSPLFFSKIDIKSYAYRMDHDLILDDFREIFGRCEQLEPLLHSLLRFPYRSEDDLPAFNYCGLPPGNTLMLTFMNLYLRKLDEALGGRDGLLYLRYGDDILIGSSSEEELEKARMRARDFLRERKLLMNEEKSERFVLLPPHQVAGTTGSFSPMTEFEYLGMRIFWRGDFTLPPRKFRRVRRFLESRMRAVHKRLSPSLPAKERAKVLSGIVAEIALERTGFRLNPIRDYLTLVDDPEQLRELDRWTMMKLTQIVVGRGWRGAHLGRLGPDRLRDYGLPSFVHLKRTGVI